MRDLDALQQLADQLGDLSKQAEVTLRRLSMPNEGNRETAISLAQKTIQLAHSCEEPHIEALAHLYLSNEIVDPAESRKHIEPALTLARSHRLRQIEAQSLFAWGSMQSSKMTLPAPGKLASKLYTSTVRWATGWVKVTRSGTGLYRRICRKFRKVF